MKFPGSTLLFSILISANLSSCMPNGNQTNTPEVKTTEENNQKTKKLPAPEPGYNFSIQPSKIDSAFHQTIHKEVFAKQHMTMDMTPLFYSTGTILNDKDTVVIMLNENTDSTCLITLYHFNQSHWIKTGKTAFTLDPFIMVDFKVILDDYNFDGTQDIFVRTLRTNGPAMDFGHLFTITAGNFNIQKQVFDPRMGNLTIHP